MKKYFKVAKYGFYIGIILWLTETLIFQILFGYHWSPINDTELYFDRASQGFILIGMTAFLLGLAKLADKIIEDN